VGARELAAFGRAEILESGADAGLLGACQKGDPQAFARLVALHERMVLDLAFRLVGDREEAKDLAQDAFLQVYKTLGRFEGRSSLKTWIYRIVLNLSRNRLRFWKRRHRAQSCPLEALAPAEEAKVSNRTESPFDACSRQELGARVQAALLRLPFEQRAILLLREAEDLSCAEIATSLGVREGTVKSRLARARDGLRRELTGVFVKEPAE
jgi:RNA polymerase sigma-70 factor (ECF subfamily)